MRHRIEGVLAAGLAALAWAGPARADSSGLPSVSSGHRPGPDALYLQPASAPQLDNAAPWTAPPILVSGASAYRGGEWLYQDWLYDDHGAQGAADRNAPVNANAFLFSPTTGTFTYPTGSGYDNNAADLVELRVKPLPDSTAFRVTLNTLENPKLAAFTIALGGTPGVNVPWPHGAGVSSPAARFLTWHGATAELSDAVTGHLITPAPAATVDMTRRQIEVRIPHSAWNPGTGVVRTTIGVGLWDDGAGTYLAPPPGAATATTPGGGAPTGVAIVNVGPRLNSQEPNPDLSMVPTWTLADSAAGAAVQARWWRESAQGAALRLGDVSPFFADVDFAKLAGGVNDDSNVPKSGPINRILASHYQFGQGFNPSNVCFDLASSFSAGAKCIGRLAGQLQSYALYVPPDKPQPPGGWGMTLLLHSLSANYNQYSASRNQSELGERGPGSLVLTPGGRGPDGFYAGIAEADTFEAWADVARHYKLDPDWTTVSGYSMGGFGTYRLLARWPDLFSRGFSTVGVPGGADPQVPALRNTPIMAWNDTGDELVPINESEAAQQHLAAAGLRFIEWLFTTSDHLTLATNDEYTPAASFLGTYRVDRDPAHVTYVVQPSQDSATASAVADHAYWVSHVRARDLKASTIGTLDVRSEGFGVGDPPASGVQQGAGTLNGGYHGPMPYVSREQDWGSAPRTPVRDALDINATNIATTSIDPARAHVDCAATLNVTTDGPLTIDFGDCGTRTFARGRSSRVLGTCSSLRRFRVRLPHRRGTRVVRVAVFVGNKRVVSSRARGAHRKLTHVVVDLRGLPPGTFHVRLQLRVITRRGKVRTLTDRHTYHTCIPKRRGGQHRHRRLHRRR